MAKPSLAIKSIPVQLGAREFSRRHSLEYSFYIPSVHAPNGACLNAKQTIKLLCFWGARGEYPIELADWHNGAVISVGYFDPELFAAWVQVLKHARSELIVVSYHFSGNFAAGGHNARPLEVQDFSAGFHSLGHGIIRCGCSLPRGAQDRFAVRSGKRQRYTVEIRFD